MTHLDLTPLVREGFALKPNLDDGTIVVQFTGNADMDAVDPLGAYLKLVHRSAVDLKVSRVSFDLSTLYFMNSSCFKAFVLWIDTVKNASRSYRIRFLTDPRMHWQRRSLEALRRLATNVVSVEGG